MSARGAELPLANDATRRTIPLIVGAMVYLAALALVGTLALDGAIRQWSDGLRGALTVQLPGVGAAPEGREAQARIEAATGVLRDTPGVLEVTTVPHEEAKALLEPWLGAGDLPANLAIPILVDVKIDVGESINFALLSERLDDAVPGTQLNDNGVILQRLVRLTRSVQLVGAAVVLIVAIAAIAIVVFATRAGMTSHRSTIELLHLMGARDGYIARRFIVHALYYGFIGGVVGLILAALTVGGLAFAARGLGAAFLPPIGLGIEALIALLCVPVASALIAMVTARTTVLRALRRIP